MSSGAYSRARTGPSSPAVVAVGPDQLTRCKNAMAAPGARSLAPLMKNT